MLLPVPVFISSIPSLEPLAGISLAVNLAYLNLQRWRYRLQVRDAAAKLLAQMRQDQKAGGPVTSQLAQAHGLMALAGENHDSKHLPIKIRVFQWIYGREVDVWLSIFFSVISAYLLCVGVAHNLHMWQGLAVVSTETIARVFFYILLSSLAAPAGNVLIGRKLVERVTKYGEDCLDQLSSLYKDKISDLPLPATPPAPAPAPAPAVPSSPAMSQARNENVPKVAPQDMPADITRRVAARGVYRSAHSPPRDPMDR